MSDRVRVGIDIGWSKKRKSCGVALAGGSLDLAEWRAYGGAVCASKMTLAELLNLISRWRKSDDLDRSIVVMDGPLGKEGRPTADREIDASCARGEFARRSQPTPVSHPSAKPFIDATYEVLDALGMSGNVWTGGPLPANGPIVIETHPTVALAIAVEQQSPDRLPSRRRARILEGTGGRSVRAKSDWYWEIGGERVVRTSLELGGPTNEHDHERVAALVCVAVATGFAHGRAIAIGDSSGCYGLLPQAHRAWQRAIEPLLLRDAPLWHEERALQFDDHEAPLEPLALPEWEGSPEFDDLDHVGGDCVDLLLCDSGGVNEKHNTWLVGCGSPVEVELELPVNGSRKVVLQHGPGRAQNRDQWVISPTAQTLRTQVKRFFPSGHRFDEPLAMSNNLVLPARIR